MKGILQFDLDDPYDKEAFLRSAKALDLALALWRVSERFRAHERRDAPQVTRQEFMDILTDLDINLDDLVI